MLAPSLSQLAGRVQHELSLCSPLQTVGIRIVSQRFATQGNVLSLVGSLAVGGRFNVKADFGALYLADDMLTAHAELAHYAASAGVPLSDWLPRTIVAVNLQLTRVLDLTDSAALMRLGLNRSQITAEWEPDQLSGITPLTQEIGRMARDAGLEAIVFPSARRQQGRNFAVFLDRLDVTSSATLINADQLAP